MADLGTRIQDYIGSFADTVALTDMATEVAKDIVNTVPPPLYRYFATESDFTSTAVQAESEAVTFTKVFDVRLGNIICREIPPALALRASDSNEMIYATTTDPVFYIRDSKINALPAGETVRYSSINYPDVDLDESAISDFPDDAVHLVVLGAAAKALLRMMSDKIDSIEGLSLNLSAYPSFPTLPSVPSITDLTISIAGIVSPSAPLAVTIGEKTVGSFGSVPAYLPPVLSLPSVPVINDLSITISNIVPPSAPSAVTIGAETVGSLGTVPTYIQPSLSLEAVPSDSGLTITATPPVAIPAPSFTYDAYDAQTTTPQIADLGVAPTYTSQSVVLSSVPTIVSFLPPTAPTPPSEPNFSYMGYSSTSTTAPTVGTVTATVPTYVRPVFTAPAFPSINSLNSILPTAPTSIVESSLTYTAPTVGGATEELTTTMGNSDSAVDFSDWFERANVYIQEEEDIELANAQISKISTYITAYNSALTNSLNEFNTQVNNYQNKLGKFSADVNKYQTDVTTAVSRWERDELQVKWNRWSTEYANLLSEYSSNIGSENNRVQAQNIEYQKDLQIQLENARYTQEQRQQDASRSQTADDSNRQKDYQAQVDKYSQSLQLYGSKLTKYSNELQSATQKFQSDFQKQFDLYRQENADKLQKYSLDIGNALNDFNMRNTSFQAQNQLNISNANLAQDEAQRDAERAQNASDANAIRSYQKTVEEYSNRLSKYSADLNSYSHQVNKEVQQYQQNLSKKLQFYTAETSNQLSKYSSDMQNNLNSFNQSNTIYQSTVQEAIQNAQMAQAKSTGDAQHEIEVYSQKLNKFSADINNYTQQVNTKVSEFQQNLGKTTQLYTSESSNLLSKYGSDMQNNLNSFNQSNAVYQSTVQKAIQNAQMAQEKATGDARHEIEVYAQKLNKFSSDINNYTQQVSTLVTEFQNNTRKEVDLYNSESQNVLSKYQAEVAGVGDDNTKKITEYTSRLAVHAGAIGELRNQYQLLKNDYDMSLNAFAGIRNNRGAQGGA